MSLPTFIGLGAAQSGTTFLYKKLDEHPEIFMAKAKELDYFNAEYVPAIESYKSWFIGAENYSVLGEVSPGYFWHEKAPERISGLMPIETKYIVVLRNPVDRCWSGYWRRRNNQKNIPEFMRYAVLSIGYCASGTQQDKNAYGNIQKGLYSVHISRCFNHLPKDNFFFITYEDLTQNTVQTLNGLYDFLGVPHVVSVTDEVVNANKYPPMPDDIRSLLKELYAPDIKKTMELTGLDLTHWL